MHFCLWEGPVRINEYSLLVYNRSSFQKKPLEPLTKGSWIQNFGSNLFVHQIHAHFICLKNVPWVMQFTNYVSFIFRLVERKYCNVQMSPHVARPLRRTESDSNRSPEWRKCRKNWIYKDYVRETKLQPEDKTNQTNQYSLSWYTAWLKYYRYSIVSFYEK